MRVTPKSQCCRLPCCTGTHSEGGIWATLFGLLMWDLLFTDVPEVCSYSVIAIISPARP